MGFILAEHIRVWYFSIKDKKGRDRNAEKNSGKRYDFSNINRG